MRACIYPGTFDPITNGHIDIITRAKKFFDKVILAVALSQEKNTLFSLDERIKIAKIATKDIANVEVVGFDNLLVDFAKNNGINVVIRGLRVVSDFEYELQMGYANNSLWSEFETIYLMPTLKNAFVSSTVVRSILLHGGDVSGVVPREILSILESKKC